MSTKIYINMREEDPRLREDDEKRRGDDERNREDDTWKGDAEWILSPHCGSRMTGVWQLGGRAGTSRGVAGRRLSARRGGAGRLALDPAPTNLIQLRLDSIASLQNDRLRSRMTLGQGCKQGEASPTVKSISYSFRALFCKFIPAGLEFY